MDKQCSRRGQLSIAFYRGSNNEPFINKLTQWWTGQFVHCELVFVDPNTGQNLACGVWQDETVFLRPKTFGRDTWSWRTITLPDDKIRKIKAFCTTQASRNIPFNKAGLIRCTTPFPRATDGTKWFCSELAVSALQHAGLLDGLIASATTPSDLYDVIGRMSSGSFQGGSVVMEQRINTKGLRFNLSKTSTPTTSLAHHHHHHHQLDNGAPSSSGSMPLRSPWATSSVV
jgi:hypothetical protein